MPGRGRSRAGARRHERQSLSLRRLCRDHRSGAGRPGQACHGRAGAGGMKMFDYIRPATIAEAVAAAATPGTAYLAGGTNLLDLMKGGVARPERIVDITPAARPRPDRTPARWRRADRRAGAQCRSGP
ncbi:MAG: FAD binding domain-containing protein [Aliidongia sp.]